MNKPAAGTVQLHWLPPDAATDLGLQQRAGSEPVPVSLEQALAVCRWVGQRRDLLRERTSVEIAEDLLRTMEHAFRREARDGLLTQATRRVAAGTGYPPPVVGRAVERFFTTQREFLEQTLAGPLTLPGPFDEFLTAGGTHRRRLFGPDLTLLIAAGNVPVAALPSVLHAFLAKSPCVARVPGGEPVLLPLLGELLWETAPLLGAAFAVLGWESGAEAVTRAVAAEADAVIAYGSDRTLAAIRALLPVSTRFLPYGHRIGFGVIGAEALSRAGVGDTAARAATDVALFDQQGCVSPHWFWVEAGGEVSPEGFAGRLAEALAAKATEWPRRALAPEEASQIHQLRAAWEVRPEARVWQSEGTDWTVVYTPDPAPEASCLNRFVFVKPVRDVVEGLPDLTPVARYLQTVVYAVRPNRILPLAAALGGAGATRLCPLGHAQEVPAGTHHDGRAALMELGRFVELE